MTHDWPFTKQLERAQRDSTAGMYAIAMTRLLNSLVQRGHRTEPVGAATNLLVANGRRSIRSMGLLPESTD